MIEGVKTPFYIKAHSYSSDSMKSISTETDEEVW
ncbi:MAG: hypothetical protein J07AB43_14050 [Candidatus Nanosalina sp. J07AB43]|nr:MAG: hypothetical protein J07AB43_14050 [Candidatus Nanosalina sp. J07AB43]